MIELKRLVATWERTQVELHGQYSLQRLRDLGTYTRETSTWACAALFLLTPTPCLLLITLLDSFELELPEQGAAANYRFWIRFFGCAIVVSVTELAQILVAIPMLQLDVRKLLAMILFASFNATASVVAIALCIGFPLPFTFPLACPAWFASIVISFWYNCGDIVRANAQVRKDIIGYLSIVICQMSLTVIYPMYAFVFATLSSHGQTAFVLVLPCLKIAAKNWVSYHMHDLHDMKPEYVIFNVEIFNALYVALCMQSSTSMLTTGILIAVDFVQAWLSLKDMQPLLRDLKALVAKMPVREGQPQLNIIEAALLVLESDREVSRHASLQGKYRQTEYAGTATMKPQGERARGSGGIGSSSSTGGLLSAITLFPSAKVAIAPSKRSQDGIDLASTKATLAWKTNRNVIKPLSSQQQPTAMSNELGLDERECLELVQKATKVLFMTEFAVLIEYAEVVTPVIYCIYIVIMFNLPNRAFYAHLADISQSQLARNISNVLLYALLELLSFIALGAVIRRKLGISATRQLTFVLQTQWCMVQSKFALWVMYVVQAYLYHSGTVLCSLLDNGGEICCGC